MYPTRDIQNLLETKKNFVRYISHEVRTPLNIVYMGLQFLTSDANRVGTENQDNAVLLGEVLDACKLAIGILNGYLGNLNPNFRASSMYGAGKSSFHCTQSERMGWSNCIFAVCVSEMPIFCRTRKKL